MHVNLYSLSYYLRNEAMYLKVDRKKRMKTICSSTWELGDLKRQNELKDSLYSLHV